MSYKLGDVLAEKFDKELYKNYIIKAWTQGVNFNKQSSGMFLTADGNIYTPMNQLAESYNSKMQALDPQVSVPEVSSSGCMVLLVVGLSPTIALTGYLISRLLA